MWSLNVLAQAAGSDASPVSIAALAAQLGLSGVFFWLYRTADSHAKKRDDQIIELASSLGPIVARATDVLDRFERSVSHTYTQAMAQPDDAVKLEQTLHLLIDHLKRSEP